MNVGPCNGQLMQGVALTDPKLKFPSAQQVKPQHVNLGQNKSQTSSQAYMGALWGSLTPAGIHSSGAGKAEAGQSWDWGLGPSPGQTDDATLLRCGQRTEGPFYLWMSGLGKKCLELVKSRDSVASQMARS